MISSDLRIIFLFASVYLLDVSTAMAAAFDQGEVSLGESYGVISPSRGLLTAPRWLPYFDFNYARAGFLRA